MLDNETRRRIDTARDILVGKIPDPKSQVEQITIALIYKFMDDMDAESEEMGGKRSFFAGDFARFGWAKLMAPGLGGFDLLNLYGEAISRMQENPHIPTLFRDIFKNAYLPYRDPETLKSFLKIIDDFSYDHSERLGDAFEYLLSVLGSQGDAGQFRTPRHIIDFMVAIIDPQKHESILDPACGTAGFLISAYKHMMQANAKDGRPGAALNPDERSRLLNHIQGYDISPDMVRLSLVNLYLHGFSDPHVDEYDTLTSTDKWNAYFDVILANPPFMSPKGGIRPHNRFSVTSKRSEVLFVDYIAEHLSPGGRAAVIVPEGVIFQSQNAYKQLRKMLVDDYLVGVISLPAGVFNPYSGVKTSILWLDKALAKKSDSILFVKIEQDGYDLGAQRREIAKDDLPTAQAEIAEYKRRLLAGEAVEEYEPTLGLVVAKQRVAENGEHNLSGERYREISTKHHVYPLVKVSDVCSTSSGGTPKSGYAPFYEGGTIPWLRSGEVAQGEIFQSEMFITEAGLANSSAKVFQPDTVLVAMYGATAGEVGILRFEAATNQAVCGISTSERIIPHFLYRLLKANKPALIRLAGGGAQPNISQKIIRDFSFPLPPLSVQEEIVAEIESYQKIIDGARQVVDNYQPRIEIDPEWPVLTIEELVSQEKYSMKAGPFGSSLKKEFYVPSGYKIYGQEQVIKGDAHFGDYYISEDKYRELESCKVKAGDVLISLVGTYGKTLIVPNDHEQGIINPRLLKLTLDPKKITPTFFVIAFAQESVMNQVHGMSYGGTMNILSLKVLKGLRIPLPSLTAQQAIVAEIEAEQALVAANQKLIEIFEQKIQKRIAKVWGE